jgi:hypothetical protein
VVIIGERSCWKERKDRNSILRYENEITNSEGKVGKKELGSGKKRSGFEK